MNKKITFVCIKSVPTLGMLKGMRYEVDCGSADANFLTSMKDYFVEEIPESEKWKVGHTVRLSGRFINLTHPSKNRYCGRGENIKDIFAKVVDIEDKPDNDYYVNITFSTEGGTRYLAENCPIRKSDCPGITEVEIYWFINSRGVICSAIPGRDVNADNWRRITHNYFNSLYDCREAYQYALKSNS